MLAAVPSIARASPLNQRGHHIRCSSAPICRSLYWTLASFVWWTYAAKLLPLLRWQENVQNSVMGASVVGMAAFST